MTARGCDGIVPRRSMSTMIGEVLDISTTTGFSRFHTSHAVRVTLNADDGYNQLGPRLAGCPPLVGHSAQSHRHQRRDRLPGRTGTAGMGPSPWVRRVSAKTCRSEAKLSDAVLRDRPRGFPATNRAVATCPSEQYSTPPPARQGLDRGIRRQIELRQHECYPLLEAPSILLVKLVA